ncbi:MAG: [Fe-Fe] hydrogenase large subunit C-terminal domain-containing protein [Clostridiaceae bacterium]|nr:[Fe-Fe] hydrogenase large subunit C-terminal domain-containing protein [Clostridiaceae bacterium]
MDDQNLIPHSVTLDVDKCMGCTTCIRHCPMEAIRVRDGKAHIITERCIDCGQCIRVCPHKAKQAVFDKWEENAPRFKYKVALPAPTLYGQFNNLDDIDYVLTGLRRFGFDMVFEVSRAAEIISDYTRKLLATGGLVTPVISSACPVVVRLIRARFPHLCEHVLPIRAPIHLAAAIARKEAIERTGLKSEEIGVFFISPCPAKVTDVKQPLGLEKSEVDCVISMTDIYKDLLKQMNKLTEPEMIARSGIMGIGWSTSGGESSALLEEKYLAADGIEQVIKVLEELEDEKLEDLEFIELNACPGGCVGGAAAVENPFVAKARIQMLRKYLPVSRNKFTERDMDELDMDWFFPLKYTPDAPLAEDMVAAMEKMRRIEEIVETFPGLDCGACGAPSCHALAEDIVRGKASPTDCLFVMKKQLQDQSAGSGERKEESTDDGT